MDFLDNLEGTVSYILLQAGRKVTPPPSFGWSPSPKGEDR